MTQPDPAPAASYDPDAEPDIRRRRWPMLVGLGLFVTLVAIALWPRALPVEAATAERGPLLVTVDEEGQTRVRNRYVVSAPSGGHLRRIELKAGAPVEAGKTVLAVLETGGADLLDASAHAQARARVRGAENARDQAAARHAAALAQLEQARLDLRRAQTLAEQNTISRDELDRAITNERVAAQEERATSFGLKVAEHDLEQARAVLVRAQPGTGSDMVEIVSPVSGRVLRVMQESARTVHAGTELLEVGDPTDLEVRVEVLSRDAAAISAGARVWLEHWGGPKPLEARVRWVEPSAFTKISALGVEEQRVYVIADLVDPVEARPTLGDGYRVEARILRWGSDNVLRVPAGALFQQAGQWRTFVIDGSRARLRTVQVGQSNGLETEITAGVADGERLIIYPGDRVTDGSRVRETTVETR